VATKRKEDGENIEWTKKRKRVHPAAIEEKRGKGCMDLARVNGGKGGRELISPKKGGGPSPAMLGNEPSDMFRGDCRL